MRGEHAKPPVAAVEEHVERAARLVRRHAEVQASDRDHGMAREERVAELSILAQHRHAVDRLGAEAVAKQVKEAASRRTRLHLLQRDDLRIQLGQNLRHPFGIEHAVAADRAVDVVCGHHGRCAGLGTLCHSYSFASGRTGPIGTTTTPASVTWYRAWSLSGS